MNEQFVYHRVVPTMHGTVLYPLNQLKHLYRDAYAEHVQKYAGRERLLESRIPLLDCLWNDVIHFTAVAPHELAENLRKGGLDLKEVRRRDWFKIPVSLLDPANTVSCIYRRDVSVVPESRAFTPFDPARMEEYRTVPPETIAYYKEQHAQGKWPLLFHLVPHILFKGTLDTQELEIVTMPTL